MTRLGAALTSALVCLALLVVPSSAAPASNAPAVGAAGLTVVASGLTNPRGFTWSPDGTLYVALAGSGGSHVAAIAGTPTGFTAGTTASVVAIRQGCLTTVAGGAAVE